MKIDGYITGFWWVTEIDRLENYYDDDFTDAGMTAIRRKVDVPSQEECNKLIKEFSSEVLLVYKK